GDRITPPPVDHFEAGGRGDAVEPVPQRRGTLEAGQSPPSAQHRVLHGLLGIGVRAEDPVAVHVQHPKVRGDQRLERVAAPAAGDYQGWMTDGKQPWAGITPAGAAPAGRWVPYVMVDDLDAAAKQAVALGATVVQDKTVGPGGTSVTVADPGGALVALFTPA